MLRENRDTANVKARLINALNRKIPNKRTASKTKNSLGELMPRYALAW